MRDGGGTGVGDQARERHDAFQRGRHERVHVDDLHVHVVDRVAGGGVRVVPGVGVDDAWRHRAVVDERIAVLEIELVAIGDLRLLPQLGTDGRLQGVAARAELVPSVRERPRVHREGARQAENRARVASVNRLPVVAVDLDDDGVDLESRWLRQRAGQVEADVPTHGGVRHNALDRHLYMVGSRDCGISPPAAGLLRIARGDEGDGVRCEDAREHEPPVRQGGSGPAGGTGER